MALFKMAALLLGLVCSSAAFSAGNIRTITDVDYGPDARQRLDVYAPANAHSAPVIFMVHGGAWMIGDKAAGRVVSHKVDHWVPKGFIVVSSNYRMLPKATPIEQARDVAKALAFAQDQAASWGGDRGQFILMGHSAGAHLVALISTSPSLTQGLGVTPWLGTVLLDSAAFDVVQVMQAKHMRFYDRAFGRQPDDWVLASPYHAMTQATAPILAVCSSQRDTSCPQAGRFVAKAVSLGSQASVLPQDLSHMEINQTLGTDSVYTEAVDAFVQKLVTPSLRPTKSGG
jgi:arylformamidase